MIAKRSLLRVDQEQRTRKTTVTKQFYTSFEPNFEMLTFSWLFPV